MITVEPEGSRFAVVYGTDHNSYPSAMRKIQDMGICDVFHANLSYNSPSKFI